MRPVSFDELVELTGHAEAVLEHRQMAKAFEISMVPIDGVNRLTAVGRRPGEAGKVMLCSRNIPVCSNGSLNARDVVLFLLQAEQAALGMKRSDMY